MDVQLGEEWILGERISGGGFGQVYAARSSSGRDGVVKLVPKAPGAQRELLFADLTDVRNVVPIIDQGETDDYWVLAMPRADMSLRDHMDASEGPSASKVPLPCSPTLPPLLPTWMAGSCIET